MIFNTILAQHCESIHYALNTKVHMLYHYDVWGQRRESKCTYRICYNGEISLQTSFFIIVEKLLCLISTISELKFNLAMFSLGKNSFPEKSLFMKNIFSRKTYFQVAFSIIWLRQIIFVEKEKYKLNNFYGKKIHQMVLIKIDTDHMREPWVWNSFLNFF